MKSRKRLLYHWAGCVEYEEAHRWQQRLNEARAQEQIGDSFLFLTHPPVYTAGTRTRSEHHPTPAVLQRHQARFVVTDRGGELTFHGPGQLVGYGVLSLRFLNNDVHKYVRSLEEALILLLRDHGLAGRRKEGCSGVWLGEAKIASIGVRIQKRVSMHGFALNVSNSLAPLRDVVACGLVDAEVTSLAEQGCHRMRLNEIAEELVVHLFPLLGYDESHSDESIANWKEV